MQHGGDRLMEPSAVESRSESSLSSPADFILVIDGCTLEWALQEELKSDFLELSCRCKAVICCRSTPLQKSQVVRLVRDQLGAMTLAVGKDSVFSHLTCSEHLFYPVGPGATSHGSSSLCWSC